MCQRGKCCGKNFVQTTMGSLEGHLVPGSMFIILSVWWFIGEVLQDRLGNGIAARAKTEPGKRQSKLIHPLWCVNVASVVGKTLFKRQWDP